MSEKLNLEPRIGDPDALYARLIDLHRDLDTSQSHALNAKLILLLANHIGDAGILDEAIRLASPPSASAHGATQ